MIVPWKIQGALAHGLRPRERRFFLHGDCNEGHRVSSSKGGRYLWG